MGKEKNKGPKGIPNKHLHARISFLHQAATYLAVQSRENSAYNEKHEAQQVPLQRDPNDQSTIMNQDHKPAPEAVSTSCGNHESGRSHSSASNGLPHHLTSNMLIVAQKSQIRLHSSIKHSTCKRCNSPLVPGQTCTKSIENWSRGGRKPHADVLVVRCEMCDAVKRFPVGAKRQLRKGQRSRDVGVLEGASAEGPMIAEAGGSDALG